MYFDIPYGKKIKKIKISENVRVIVPNKVEIKVKYLEMNQIKEKSFEVLSVEPILNSLEKEFGLKLTIESGCRSGACALCRTKLTSGKIFVPPDVTIREVDQKFGYIHPCISYPLTNLSLDLT